MKPPEGELLRPPSRGGAPEAPPVSCTSEIAKFLQEKQWGARLRGRLWVSREETRAPRTLVR